MGERIVITIECVGGTCKIVDRLPSVPIRKMYGDLAYRIERFQKDDIYVRLFNKRSRVFPLGLLPMVIKILRDNEIEFDVKNAKSNFVKLKLPIISDKYGRRPYQDECITEAIKQFIGVIRLPTGGGKTVVAGHIMSAIGMPSLFLVHTKDLLYQAIDAFSDMFGSEKVGQIGDSKVDIREITVATTQSMCRVFDAKYEQYEYEDVEEWEDEQTDITGSRGHWIREAMSQIGIVFHDECHRVAAPTVMGLMEALINPVYRIGLSASPWRDDGADMAIQACLGDVIYSKTASDLTPEYLVPPIIRTLDVPPMGFKRNANFMQVYSHYIVHNEERNKMIVDNAVSMVHRQKPTMVLVTRIQHGNLLQDQLSEELGFRVPFISGKDSSSVRKSILDDIRKGRLGVFIASTIADEGLDIKPLQGLVLGGAGKSSTKALQRIGRLLRPYKGKVDAEVVDFSDNAKFLVNHSARRLDLYSTEEKWDIIDF